MEIKLDSNENPFGPSPAAIKAMQAVLADCYLYPEDESPELRQRLAEYHSVRPEQIVVTSGLTDLLGVLTRAFLAPGLNAVTSERSFVVYPIATKAAGAQLIQVPMHENRFDLQAIASAVNQDTRIIFLANPNNPTGTLVTADEIEDFLERIPDHVVLILDEAYYEYAAHFAAMRGVKYSSSLDYVRQGRKVVVLRTFSKVHGLAGLRVGYGIAPAALIAQIRRKRTIYAVSRPAQAAAIAALADEAHIRKSVESNAREAERLTTAISEFGFRVVRTWANFLYCDVGKEANAIAQRLESERITVRSLDKWGAPEALRISVGNPEQNAILLKTLQKILQG